MKFILLIVSLSIISLTSLAADLKQESAQFCTKIKSCALAELEGQDIPADLREMATSAMEGMCHSISDEFDNEQIQEYEELSQKAASCMNSMSSLSCDVLMNGEMETPACTDFEKSMSKYE